MPEKKHTQKVLLIPIFLLAIYLGYCIGSLYGMDHTFKTAADQLRSIALHPFPLQLTPMTGKSILVCMAAALTGTLYYESARRNYMPGREYGTARLAEPKELNRHLQDSDPHRNKIITEHVRISLNTRQTNLNNNMLVIGGPGGGKSFRVVKPNGYNQESSYVFCDPKGELLRDIGNYLKLQGYRIRVLNLVNMAESDGYNPLAYLRSDEDVVKLVTNLIANTTPKGSSSSDPFWTKAESMYLQAVILYVWYEFPKQGQKANFRGVMELLNKAKVSQSGKEDSELDILMQQLPENHPALITYKKVVSGAADTIRSIIISAHSRLAYLQNEAILRILDEDEMEIRTLGEGIYENPDRRTALFCVIPDSDKSYNFLVGLLYTQLFQELYYIADHKYGGQLPIHVALWMDEFANTALPDDFLRILATCRSREISCNIIIQNLAQLKTLFKDAWEEIPGSCDTVVYLGGNEQGSHEYISKLLGKQTIDKKTTGESRGGHGSSSRNYDVIGREILTPDEVRKLDNKLALVIVKGYDAVCDEKYRTWEKAEYRQAEQLGIYQHTKDHLPELAQIAYYIDATGETAQKQSFRYQVESYGGIFEESQIWKDIQKTGDGLYLPEWYGGYFYEGLELYPFFTLQAETIQTAAGPMKKHAITACHTDQGQALYSKEELSEIFLAENRITVSESLL